MRWLRELFGRSRGEDKWIICTGTIDGVPVITRANSSIKRRQDLQRELQHEVKIVIPIREPNPNGFAFGKEWDEIYEIEQQLIRQVEVEGETMLVATAHGGGTYEFELYTKHPDAVRLQIQQIANESTTHNLQFMVQLDPSWDIYKQLTP